MGRAIARLGGGAPAEGVGLEVEGFRDEGVGTEEDVRSFEAEGGFEEEARVSEALALLIARPIDRLLAACDDLERRPFALVAIDGPGGSGKTRLAERILRAAAGRSVVHVDDFYRPAAEHTQQTAETLGGSFDLGRLRDEVLRPLRERRSASFRPLDWERGELAAQPDAVDPRGLAVVEGVYTLRPDLMAFWDLTVFLDVPLELCRARLLARGENTTEEIDGWQAEERRYLETSRPMERAAIVLGPDDAET